MEADGGQTLPRRVDDSPQSPLPGTGPLLRPAAPHAASQVTSQQDKARLTAERVAETLSRTGPTPQHPAAAAGGPAGSAAQPLQPIAIRRMQNAASAQQTLNRLGQGGDPMQPSSLTGQVPSGQTSSEAQSMPSVGQSGALVTDSSRASPAKRKPAAAGQNEASEQESQQKGRIQSSRNAASMQARAAVSPRPPLRPRRDAVSEQLVQGARPAGAMPEPRPSGTPTPKMGLPGGAGDLRAAQPPVDGGTASGGRDASCKTLKQADGEHRAGGLIGPPVRKGVRDLAADLYEGSPLDTGFREATVRVSSEGLGAEALMEDLWSGQALDASEDEWADPAGVQDPSAEAFNDSDPESAQPQPFLGPSLDLSVTQPTQKTPVQDTAASPRMPWAYQPTSATAVPEQQPADAAHRASPSPIPSSGATVAASKPTQNEFKAAIPAQPTSSAAGPARAPSAADPVPSPASNTAAPGTPSARAASDNSQQNSMGVRQQQQLTASDQVGQQPQQEGSVEVGGLQQPSTSDKRGGQQPQQQQGSARVGRPQQPCAPDQGAKPQQQQQQQGASVGLSGPQQSSASDQGRKLQQPQGQLLELLEQQQSSPGTAQKQMLLEVMRGAVSQSWTAKARQAVLASLRDALLQLQNQQKAQQRPIDPLTSRAKRGISTADLLFRREIVGPAPTVDPPAQALLEYQCFSSGEPGRGWSQSEASVLVGLDARLNFWADSGEWRWRRDMAPYVIEDEETRMRKMRMRTLQLWLARQQGVLKDRAFAKRPTLASFQIPQAPGVPHTQTPTSPSPFQPVQQPDEYTCLRACLHTDVTPI